MEPTASASPEKMAALEALLFIHGEPMTREKIGRILTISKEEVEILLEKLKKRLEESDRGLTFVTSGERVQLVTKSSFRKIVEEFMRQELSEDLTPASLETISLIAYFGPISRVRIEYLRGVNSSFILRSLLIRGLIARTPDPAQSQSFLYEPSMNLIKHLGLRSREELPDYEKFQSLIKSTESPSQNEMPHE